MAPPRVDVFVKEGSFVKYLFWALFICALSCATVWGQATAQINGTVTVPGQQSMQFQIFVKWGMTPIEALQTATVNAAAFLNDYLHPRVGRIKPGAFADIIAVPGDPLADMKLMMNVPFVMKGGVIFRDDIKAKTSSN